ncbi:hypothetical protein E3N88_41704 [Mikania micrantha]|uniref:Uncharacterized protein n=1 Tax=Mikania micrantha TaxID=192012 RepID=A0A5N6LJW4_9ASTR|nr:hypothetical protein E3N88_41704 [Mikania micrantha]
MWRLKLLQVDSIREMMNVGENRARNGVTDCPESRNEENFQSMELLDSSRYAKERLRILRDFDFERNDIVRIVDYCLVDG